MSLLTKLLSADTRDILSLLVGGLLVVGTVGVPSVILPVFDSEKVLIIVSVVFSFWFGTKTNNGSNGHQ